MERSDRAVEKRKVRLLECMKYKTTILLYTRRFKGIQVRERFVYEEFTERMHEPPKRKPRIPHRREKIILHQGQIPSMKTGGLLKQVKDSSMWKKQWLCYLLLLLSSDSAAIYRRDYYGWSQLIRGISSKLRKFKSLKRCITPI